MLPDTARTTAPPSTPEHVDDAPATADALLAEARRIFALQQAYRWTVAATSARERAAKLARLGAAIEAHRTALHAAMWADFHKAPEEVDLAEIQPTLAELAHARRHVARWMRPRRVRTPGLLFGARSEVRSEPRGVALVMAPWNYPVYLLLTPLVAAVAAGNCAILRPSEKVPQTAAVLARIVRAAFEEREVACLTESGIALAEGLLALPFDHVFFTGSTRVGRRVMAAAAEHLATVTLELGGKSPVVVDETADVALAAERAVWGKCINAGQTCVAPDYALVDERVAPAFVAAAAAAIARFYGATEEARRTSLDLPRAIDAAAFRRLAGLLEDAVAAGARVAVGGTVDAATRYVAPTILTDVPWDAAVMREEIFGPILPVLAFRSLDEAIARIDAGGTPLALYVFSRRRANVERVLARTRSGGATVNNVVVHLGNPNLPFGGVGASGQGSYHGPYGFRAFSHERSVLRQGRFSLLRLYYPPYGPRTRRVLQLVRRFLT